MQSEREDFREIREEYEDLIEAALEVIHDLQQAKNKAEDLEEYERANRQYRAVMMSRVALIYYFDTVVCARFSLDEDNPDGRKERRQ